MQWAYCNIFVYNYTYMSYGENLKLEFNFFQN